METKIIKVGTSLGLIIPKLIAKDYDLENGTQLEINIANSVLVIKKKRSVREGWDDAFARYAKERADESLLPEFIDSEADLLL